jgi:hypothetical protein
MLIFVVHPTDHEIRVYCLGLRLTNNSLFASSETKQAATPYGGRTMVCSQRCLTSRHPKGIIWVTFFDANAIAAYDGSRSTPIDY